jgi:hypothetical protein
MNVRSLSNQLFYKKNTIKNYVTKLLRIEKYVRNFGIAYDQKWKITPEKKYNYKFSDSLLS